MVSPLETSRWSWPAALAVVSLVGSLLYSGMFIGGARAELDSQAGRIVAIEAKVQDHDELQRDVAVIKNDVSSIKDDLREIKDRLNKLSPAPFYGYTPPEK